MKDCGALITKQLGQIATYADADVGNARINNDADCGIDDDNNANRNNTDDSIGL